MSATITAAKPDALLFVDPFSKFAMMHVFEFETRKCIRTLSGYVDDLKRIYGEQFRILTFGVCQVCECTDHDCSRCIAKTGERCHWVNEEHTLCSACALGLLKLGQKSSGPITCKTTA